MAFNAGEIEATLTLTRTPFQQGLEQAKAEADEFARNHYEVTLGAKGEEARAEIQRTRVSAEEFARMDPTATLHVRNVEALGEMEQAKTAARELATERPTIRVATTSAQATTEMAAALAEAKRVEAEKILLKVRMDKEVLDGQIEGLRAQLARLMADETTLRFNGRQVAEMMLKLGALEAEAATLDRKEITLRMKAEGLDQVKQATQQASEGMSQVATYAGLAAAAFPAVGAAIVALPGLIAAAAAPMLAVKLGADGIKAALEPLSPLLINLSGQISDTFQGALEPAVRNIAAVLPTLQDGLTGTATSLSGLAENVTAVVASSTGLRSIFDGVNSLITQLTPGIAGLTANVIGLAQQGIAGLQPLGAIFTQLSAEWQQVIATLQRTGQGQAAVAALVQVLGGLLQILPPLVQFGASLMAAIGPPLAAALQATAAVLGPIANLFSALPGPVQTVTAAVIAFRVAMAFLGSSGSEAAAGTRAIATAAGEAATSAEQAASSTSRLGQAFSTAMTPVRAVGSAFTEMGASYKRVVTGIQEDTGGATNALQRFGTVAAGSAAAGATGLKLAVGGLFSALGGLPGLLIGGVSFGLGLLADHMQASAQKAQDLAQLSQSVADSLSRTGGVITSQTTSLIANAAAQDKLLQTTSQLGIASTDVTNAITAGGPALDGMRTRLQGIVDANTTLVTDMNGLTVPVVNATGRAAQDALGKLNDLAKSMSDGQTAAKTLADAMGGLGDHFGAAKVAAQQATAETALYAQAMKDAGDDTKSASDRIGEFAGEFQKAADVPRTFLASQLAANKALDEFGKSVGKIPAGVITLSGAINTSSEAGQKLGNAILSAGKAYDSLYGSAFLNARQQGQDVPAAFATAAASVAGYREKIIDLAVQNGRTREEAQRMVDTYLTVPPEIKTQIEAPGMLEAALGALGLKDKIEQIPGHKGVVVDTNSPAVIAQLEAMGYKVTTLPKGKIEIDADTTKAVDGINRTVTFSNGQTGTMKFDANPDPATGKIRATVDLGNGQTGVMTYDANPDPADGKIHATVDLGNGQLATMTFDADPQKATGQINGTVHYANGQTGTMHLASEDSQARSTIAGTVHWIETLHPTVYVSFIPTGPASPGNIRLNNPTAGGGVFGYAGGGFNAAAGGVIPGYDPGIDTIPAVLSRGEAVLVPELVRQLGAGRILAANAQASGGRPATVVGDIAAMMDGTLGVKPTAAGLSQVASRLSPSASRPSVVRGGDGAASGDVITELRALRAAVERMKTGADVTINAPTYNPTAEPSSESQARALRTGAELARLVLR